MDKQAYIIQQLINENATLKIAKLNLEFELQKERNEKSEILKSLEVEHEPE